MLAMTHNWPLDVAELKPALELVLAIARTDMGILMLHDDGEGAMFPVLGCGLDETNYALFGSPRPGIGAFGRAMTEHRRVRIRNAWGKGEALSDAARTLGFRSIEVLPFFRDDGGALGAFGVLFRSVHGSGRRAAKLTQFCTDVVGCAVRHAEEQVRAERSRERHAIASDAKIQFLAKLSHELRTPLQSISGYVDLLRASELEPLTPAQDHMLARISESERILVRIIDDVITISRLEAGRVSYSIGPASAEDAMRATEAVIAPLATDHDIHIEIAPSVQHLLVHADADKLKQILVNLAANAVKFTRAPGKVTLSCRADDDSVWFDVSDTGPGIPPDRLGEIFNPYVQLGSPAIDSYGGSGLGLTISREFATGMQGELTASSDTHQGSVFTLRLPRCVRTPSANSHALSQDERGDEHTMQDAS
jgi:signal transduction histidine kinase